MYIGIVHVSTEMKEIFQQRVSENILCLHAVEREENTMHVRMQKTKHEKGNLMSTYSICDVERGCRLLHTYEGHPSVEYVCTVNSEPPCGGIWL